MSEEFLQYIWQHKLFKHKEYILDDGETVEIIDTGIKNTDSGPDFFNAKIKIGNTLWAGNIEIHKESSEWYSHGHNKDKAYNNVILHVVYKISSGSINEKGNKVPVLKLEFSDSLLKNYTDLLRNKNGIFCKYQLEKIDNFYISFWLDKLAIERVNNKTDQINSILNVNQNNWEESFYQYLCRSFGFGTNGNPFELLARSVSLKVLSKHKDNLNHIEAILFGQSGLLQLNETNDEYTMLLNTHYDHFKKKYGLKPIDGFIWKFMRLRPVNFPTVRIAQLSMLVFKSVHLLSKIKETKKLNQLYELLKFGTSEYWKNHYHFSKESKTKEKIIGNESIKSLVINTIVPFLYIYGDKTGDEDLKTRSFNFLNEISPERNNIIKEWELYGIYAGNAYESQALIQLRKEYCNKKKCIYCAIGNEIIKSQK